MYPAARSLGHLQTQGAALLQEDVGVGCWPKKGAGHVGVGLHRSFTPLRFIHSSRLLLLGLCLHCAIHFMRLHSPFTIFASCDFELFASPPLEPFSLLHIHKKKSPTIPATEVHENSIYRLDTTSTSVWPKMRFFSVSSPSASRSVHTDTSSTTTVTLSENQVKVIADTIKDVARCTCLLPARRYLILLFAFSIAKHRSLSRRAQAPLSRQAVSPRLPRWGPCGLDSGDTSRFSGTNHGMLSFFFLFSSFF
jgi:hypothetical protein